MVSANGDSSRNILGLKLDSTIQKGATIGAYTGAAVGLGASALDYSCAKIAIPSDKDAFVKSMHNDAKQIYGELDSNSLNEVTKHAEEQFSYLAKKSDDLIKDIKKAIPSKVGKFAGIGLVIGAGVGLLIKFIKGNSKKT